MSTNLPQSKWLHKVAEGIEWGCRSCRGLGIWQGMNCPVCQGTGNADDHYRPYSVTGVGGWLRDRPCPECKGIGIYGFDPANEGHAPQEVTTCDSCYGSGKKGIEWPSLVWIIWSPENSQLIYLSGYDPEECSFEYIHALEYLDAFALLEEVGWRFVWESDKRSNYHWSAMNKPDSGDDFYRDSVGWSEWIHADSPDELLNQIMAEEVQHGTADGR